MWTRTTDRPQSPFQAFLINQIIFYFARAKLNFGIFCESVLLFNMRYYETRNIQISPKCNLWFQKFIFNEFVISTNIYKETVKTRKSTKNQKLNDIEWMEWHHTFHHVGAGRLCRPEKLRQHLFDALFFSSMRCRDVSNINKILSEIFV